MSENVRVGSGINYRAVAVAAAVPLVVSSVWYIIFGNAWLTLRGLDPGTTDTTPEAWVLIAQFARNVAEAAVLAILLRRVGTATWGGALRLGLLAWFGLQAMTIAGSVLHEQYPLGLYAIHVGDALVTTLVMVSILSLWPRRRHGSGPLNVGTTSRAPHGRRTA